ncbi:MAG: dihydrolipoamide acetyltransferase family protein [Acidobacteriota bacterium]|nr:dihydrolipoamide acetyltransferase family protein [Acidobacteriota bacterium]
MAEITMPKLSDTMEDGVVVRWLKRVGEAVAKGELVAEIETDKATMEMESLEDGVLSKIHVEEGQRVSVGEPMAAIEAGGHPSQSPVLAAEVASPEIAVGTSGRATPSERVKASPRARKAAGEMNLDLAGVTGSGPSGRILYRDVVAASGAGASSGQPSAAVSQPVPLSSMRQLIAERMVESKTRIPHFYLQVEIDAEPLLEFQGQVNSALDEWGGSKLSVNDLVLKATAMALTRVPQLNASFTGEGILRHGHVNLEFAVSLQEGLLTPVIRNADSKNLRQISLEAGDLIERARTQRLNPDEYRGGTFTVSNLGARGIDSFQAIIDPPQAAILGVGAIVRKPVVDKDDRIRPGHRINLTLSCDHRVVDGAVAAEFMGQMRRLLQQPALLLL